GPPGRHFPRALRRRRRRPFVAFSPVEMLPSNGWIAEPTSCCTMSRITVTKLLCLGIVPPFGYRTASSVVIRKAPLGGTASSPIAQRHSGCEESGGGWVGQRDRGGRG